MNKLAIAQAMIAHYNAQDADAYVALMTEDAVEAVYLGEVLRVGQEGVRSALKKMFAEFPENRAQIISAHEIGDFVVLHERVSRTSAGPSFEVMSIYSFESEKCSRVDFVR